MRKGARASRNTEARLRAYADGARASAIPSCCNCTAKAFAEPADWIWTPRRRSRCPLLANAARALPHTPAPASKNPSADATTPARQRPAGRSGTCFYALLASMARPESTVAASAIEKAAGCGMLTSSASDSRSRRRWTEPCLDPRSEDGATDCSVRWQSSAQNPPGAGDVRTRGGQASS